MTNPPATRTPPRWRSSDLPIMEQLIPIFPLEVVVYHGDELNLHIFEPRYQQLINDTVKTKMFFGITTVIDRVFSFAEAPAAYRYQESGAHFGKVVITLS